MTEKKTKKMFYNEIAELGRELDRPDLVEFANHEIELLERKNSSKGATKTQVENEKVMEIIFNELKALARPVTVSDLMEESETIKNYVLENGDPLRNQKISALLKKLVDSNRVIKSISGKKSYFSC